MQTQAADVYLHRYVIPQLKDVKKKLSYTTNIYFPHNLIPCQKKLELHINRIEQYTVKVLDLDQNLVNNGVRLPTLVPFVYLICSFTISYTFNYKTLTKEFLYQTSCGYVCM